MFCMYKPVCSSYGLWLYIKNIYFLFLTQVWAVSGERRGSSGRKMGSIPLKWATLAVTRQTPPMKRCAQVCDPPSTLTILQPHVLL